MHTAVQLRSEQFAVLAQGKPAPFTTLFAHWGLHDRVGVLVDEPFGTLGASLLIQAAIAQYFDYRREYRAVFEAFLDREGERESLEGSPKGFGMDPMARVRSAGVASPGYADIYVLHVGKRHGDHMGMDIWPPNREILVPHDFDAIVTALADLGITRLLIPENAPDVGTTDWEIRAVLRERVTDVFVYSARGHVESADLEITGLSPVLEQNPHMMLNMRASMDVAEKSGPSTNPEGTAKTFAFIKARFDEVSPEIQQDIMRQRAASMIDGQRVETYRRVSLQKGLDMIAGMARRGA